MDETKESQLRGTLRRPKEGRTTSRLARLGESCGLPNPRERFSSGQKAGAALAVAASADRLHIERFVVIAVVVARCRRATIGAGNRSIRKIGQQSGFDPPHDPVMGAPHPTAIVICPGASPFMLAPTLPGRLHSGALAEVLWGMVEGVHELRRLVRRRVVPPVQMDPIDIAPNVGGLVLPARQGTQGLDVLLRNLIPLGDSSRGQ